MIFRKDKDGLVADNKFNTKKDLKENMTFKLREFMGKAIHPNFTETDEDIYYLKKEVDKHFIDRKRVEDVFDKLQTKLALIDYENINIHKKVSDEVKKFRKGVLK